MPRDASWLPEVIRHAQTVDDRRMYFAQGPIGKTFTGRAFESIGGGGDRAAVKDRVTAEDLIAVEMLCVQVPPEVAIKLLDGDLGAELGACLEQIPSDVAIGTPDGRRGLLQEPYVNAAWKLLRTQVGVGWVIAGKLLARKRPKLIQVYDQVVRDAIDAPRSDGWAWFQARFEDERVRIALREVAAEAAVPSHISMLRTLDIILWMRHR